MKTICKTLVLAAALTVAWGCGSGSDDGVEGGAVVGGEAMTHSFRGITFAPSDRPAWEVDWTWHDAAPDWQNPDPSKYESRMYVILKLDGRYDSYCTDDDRMGLFLDRECRGVARRTVGNDDAGNYFFIMVSGDNASDSKKMEIRYYCARMKQIFVMPGFFAFSPNVTIGDTSDQVIPFGCGSPKYLRRSLTVWLAGNVPFASTPQDVVGLFVDGECRGLGRAGEDIGVYVAATDLNELVYLRYFSAEKGGIYSVEQPVDLEEVSETTINFQKE